MIMSIQVRHLLEESFSSLRDFFLDYHDWANTNKFLPPVFEVFLEMDSEGKFTFSPTKDELKKLLAEQ